MEKCNRYLIGMLVGMLITIIGMGLIIGGLVSQIRHFKEEICDQKTKIQQAYEQRDRNPIIIVIPQIEFGMASWYGEPEHGQIRADGEVYDMFELHTAAHSKLPLGTVVLVTNLKNHKSVIVRINDRLPRIWNKSGRIVDLSFAAGQEVDMIRDGLVRVELKVIITSEDMTPEMIHENREILETIDEKK